MQLAENWKLHFSCVLVGIAFGWDYYSHSKCNFQPIQTSIVALFICMLLWIYDLLLACLNSEFFHLIFLKTILSVTGLLYCSLFDIIIFEQFNMTAYRIFAKITSQYVEEMRLENSLISHLIFTNLLCLWKCEYI